MTFTMDAESLAAYISCGVMLGWNIIQQIQLSAMDRRSRYADVTLEAVVSADRKRMVLVNHGSIGIIVQGAEDDMGRPVRCLTGDWQPVIMPHDGSVIALTDDAPDWVHITWREHRRRPFHPLRRHYSMVCLRPDGWDVPHRPKA